MSTDRRTPTLADPRLALVAEQLERTRGASSLCDAQGRMVWVSSELRKLLGSPADEELGLGKHVVQAYASAPWSSKLTLESQLRSFAQELPMVLGETPGGKEAVKAMLLDAFEVRARTGELTPSPEVLDELFEHIEPVPPPPFRTNEFDFVQGDLPPARIVEMHVRLHADDGEYIGTAVLFDPGLPATVLSLVARGDEAMFERMARLIEPGRRRAAILFADVQASSVISRQLPSAAYFRLVRALTTAMDDCVIRETGIVGKHAGDGVTAFFLSEDLGSDSAAAAAAIRAARAIADVAARAAKEVADETGLVEVADCPVNVGLHWGEALYMGQVVTGGRLEVTALGDRVNEAARIQQCARDGEVLASKSLLEQLADGDAVKAGVDPDVVVYRTVDALDAATEKAVRDAGGIPVTAL